MIPRVQGSQDQLLSLLLVGQPVLCVSRKDHYGQLEVTPSTAHGTWMTCFDMLE
jgi:hypothetical protein